MFGMTVTGKRSVPAGQTKISRRSHKESGHEPIVARSRFAAAIQRNIWRDHLRCTFEVKAVEPVVGNHPRLMNEQKEIDMDAKKRMALILPFAGLAGFGMANLGSPSPGLIGEAKAECEVLRDDNDDCFCVGQSGADTYCTVSLTITKDKDGNVISRSKSCNEEPGCHEC
jgi:hypothetical protein